MEDMAGKDLTSCGDVDGEENDGEENEWEALRPTVSSRCGQYARRLALKVLAEAMDSIIKPQ